MDVIVKSSSARLWKLVEERTKPDADVATIDQRIWDLFGEDLAILFTVGRLLRHVAKFGIVHFLQSSSSREARRYDRRRRRAAQIHADSLLVCSASRQGARLRDRDAAVCQAVSARRPPEEKLVLCCGVGWGRVLKIGDDDVFGHEVNLASKLGEDIAKGDEIIVTTSARAAIGELAGATWESITVNAAGEDTAWRVTY
jgi:hypothetical protein